MTFRCQNYTFLGWLGLSPVLNTMLTVFLSTKGQPGARSCRFVRGPGKGRTHLGVFVRSLSLQFARFLFPRLEPVTSWSQGGHFTAAPRLPLVFLSTNNQNIINHSILLNIQFSFSLLQLIFYLWFNLWIAKFPVSSMAILLGYTYNM
jgi:hypothetical protein